MDFAIYSRRGIEACAPHDDVDHVIVSIRSPGDPREVRLPLCPRTLGVLHLVFHDLDVMPPEMGPGLMRLGFSELEAAADAFQVPVQTLFNASMAKQVVDFIRTHETHAGRIERVIVHCDAGLSRSPAVAAALSLGMFGGDRETDASFFTRFLPNRRVYRAILEAVHER